MRVAPITAGGSGTGAGRGWFAGQVAVVTGAGSGIGAAVVRRLLLEGCRVVVALDLRPEGLGQHAGLTGVETAEVDVADPVQVDAVFGGLVDRLGRVDVVVHAAGVDDPESKEKLQRSAEQGQPALVIDQLSDQTWQRMIAVNTGGTFHLLRAAARAMLPRGSGAIVTVGSSAAFDTIAGYGAYVASKAAAQALSQSVAKELAPFGIRVNTVAPGPVDTGMAARTPSHVREALAASGARGYATADELADTIVYLASPGAVNVIGAVVLSNAGRFTV